MDISHWGWGKIMQLPDHLFGRRFMVSIMITAVKTASVWDISEIALPEKCVLWEFQLNMGIGHENTTRLSLALGDQLPTTNAQFMAMEPILHGLGVDGIEPRNIDFGADSCVITRWLRQNIDARGRRVVMELTAGAEAAAYANAQFIFSSVPRELPDWFLQRQA
ncbi:hypothetical protein ES705_31411 [subsurface metagenome]